MARTVPAWSLDPNLRYEVAKHAAQRLRMGGEWGHRARELVDRYLKTLEHGRNAREYAARYGLRKKDWTAVRAAVIDALAGGRHRGKVPPVKPRAPRRGYQERDPIPDWAKEPDAPEHLILGVERGSADADVGAALSGRPQPQGWFASVQMRSGTTMEFSRLDGEDEWHADSCFGPKMEPMWSNGRGARYLATRRAKDPLASHLNRAVLLAERGEAGPYDPRSLGMTDVPGQTRMFNPVKKHGVRAFGDPRWRGYTYPDDLPAGATDSSWRNDASPSFYWPSLRVKLWVEHPDPWRREVSGPRYTLTRTDEDGLVLEGEEEGVLSTDDWGEMKATILRLLADRESNPSSADWNRVVGMSREQARRELSR